MGEVKFVARKPIILEITRHQSFLFFIHVFITGTLQARGLAPSSRPLFPPTSPPSNGPGRAPEATDRLDIVAGDY